MGTIKKGIALFIVIAYILVGAGLRPVQAITVTEEEKLAREFLEVVHKHYRLIKDPVIADYVETLGQDIVSSAGPQPFKYRFYVIDEQVFNAFASPAGHIFIYSGLIALLESEEELAGILAHEIAHVTCRHISKRIERMPKIGLVTLAGVAAAIVLGAAGAGAAANATGIGAAAAGQSMELAYSRQDERQADHFGLEYLTKADYDPEGLLKVQKKLLEKRWFGPDQVPAYLMTHPLSEERITNIDAWIETHDHPQKEKQRDDSRFTEVHSRIMALYTKESAAASHFRSKLADSPENPVYLHGMGLALSRLGKRDEAIEYLRRALKKQAFSPVILTDLGRMYYLDGQVENAVNMMEGALSLRSDYPPALYYLGRLRLETGRYDSAKALLKKLQEKEPKLYPDGPYFLGQALGRSGDTAESHFQFAVYHRSKGDLKTARYHLKKALSLTTEAGRKKEMKNLLEKIDKARSEQDDRFGPR